MKTQLTEPDVYIKKKTPPESGDEIAGMRSQ